MVLPTRFDSSDGIHWETSDEVIIRYKINRKTFLRWVDMGLPVHRFPGGRHLRFDPAEVDRWFIDQGSRNRCSSPNADEAA